MTDTRVVGIYVVGGWTGPGERCSGTGHRSQGSVPIGRFSFGELLYYCKVRFDCHKLESKYGGRQPWL